MKPVQNPETTGMYDGPGGHYDLLTDVLTKHVPVVIGLVAFLLVLVVPFIYDYFRKPGEEDEPKRDFSDNPFAKKPKNEISVYDKETFELFEKAMEDADVQTAEKLASDISHNGVRLKALIALGDFHFDRGHEEDGEGFYIRAVEVGPNMVDQGVLAGGAEKLSIICEKRSDKETALSYARKSLIWYDMADDEEKVKTTSERIKQLKAG